jgi:hypothetical protein
MSIQLNMLRIENIAMAAIAALAFQLSFGLTGMLDGYFAYAQGISLLFLPAGVKLLFVLVGRIPALVGLTAMAAYAAVGEWVDYSLWVPISFAVVAQANYYLAVYLVMRILGIDRELSNLRYRHVIVLSLAASVTNGVIHNVLYWAEGVSLPEDFLRRSAAMTLGDFFGCFVVVGLFHAALTLHKALKTSALQS